MRRLVPPFPALAALAAPAAFLSACPTGDVPQLYRTEPLAPSLTEPAVAALDHLGPSLVDQGLNFGVYSEAATRVDLLLFDEPEDDRPTWQFEMSRFGDVWNLYVEGVGLGQHYGYVAWGPNWPYDPDWYPGSIAGFVSDVDESGNRFNPNKLLFDPYGLALHRDHDWSRGSSASGPARTQSTWGAAAKSVVVSSDYEWSSAEDAWREGRRDGTLAGHGFADSIVYEVHPKGLTADPSSGVEHPGTFRGVGEMAPYLADLGVSVVELLPVHEKPLDGGYWGYNNLSFFAPERSYAADPDPREIINEFKGMVDALHQAGLELWLDVVFNHTGEGGLWRERIYQDDVALDPGTDAAFYNFDPSETAGIFSYRGLDNAAWYALSADGREYWNNTGVGNQSRPNHTPMRRLILDSLHFMVEELHVDGFRFDLAPILGERDLDYNNWDDPADTVLQDIVDDPVLVEWNTRIVAEPWSAGGNYNPVIGAFPAGTDPSGNFGWGEWNGRFRDWWRSFVNDDAWRLNWQEAGVDGGGTLTGSALLFQDDGRRPYHSQNFVTVHDGMTMYDLLTYEEKQNGCGPLNPVCCDDPTSTWCETDNGEDHNRSRNWGMDPLGEAMKRQMMRNWFAALMIAQGSPLILGGDEWMRTQHGNNNAYSTLADNAFNWLQWGTWQQDDARVRMHDFVKQIIELRKSHGDALAPEDWGAAAPFAWKGEANAEPPDWGSRRLMMHWYDESAGPQLLVLVNMERYPVDFTLPAGLTWRRLVDTQRWFDFENPDAADDFFDGGEVDTRRSWNATLDSPEEVPAGSYGVQDSSIVILEAAP